MLVQGFLNEVEHTKVKDFKIKLNFIYSRLFLFIGYVANEVETEQIVHNASISSFQKGYFTS
jgi:hypothetical protein